MISCDPQRDSLSRAGISASDYHTNRLPVQREGTALIQRSLVESLEANHNRTAGAGGGGVTEDRRRDRQAERETGGEPGVGN